MYSSLGDPFFPQSVVFGTIGCKEAARDFLSFFFLIPSLQKYYEIDTGRSGSGSVGLFAVSL